MENQNQINRIAEFVLKLRDDIDAESFMEVVDEPAKLKLLFARMNEITGYLKGFNIDDRFQRKINNIIDLYYAELDLNLNGIYEMYYRLANNLIINELSKCYNNKTLESELRSLNRREPIPLDNLLNILKRNRKIKYNRYGRKQMLLKIIFNIFIRSIVCGHSSLVLKILKDNEAIVHNLFHINDALPKINKAIGHSNIDTINILSQYNLLDDNSLYWASYYGNLNIVKFLIAKGFTRHLNSALAIASENVQPEVVNYLVQLGATVNARTFISVLKDGNRDILHSIIDSVVTDDKDISYLVYASRAGKITIVELLLKCGVKANSRNNEALIAASRRGHLDIIKLLLENGAEANRTTIIDPALIYACKTGNIVMVEFLLDKGADINAGNGKALMNASGYGHYETVEFLLNNGAELNNLSLVYASINGHIEIVTLLLNYSREKGVEIDKDGKALVESIINRQIDVSMVLLDSNSNTNWNSVYTVEILNTALIEASKYGYDQIIQLLIDKGAEVDVGNNLPLIIASKYGHIEIVNILLENNANADAQDSLALVWASKYDYATIVELLLEYGARADARNSDSLIVAVKYGYIDIVRILLENGAQADAQNNAPIKDDITFDMEMLLRDYGASFD